MRADRDVTARDARALQLLAQGVEPQIVRARLGLTTGQLAGLRRRAKERPG